MIFKRFRPIFIPIILLFLLPHLFAHGGIPQNQQGEPAQETSDSIQILPFQTTGITDAFNQSFNLIVESGKKRLTDEELTEYKEEIDTLFLDINNFLGDSSIQSIESLSLRELDNISPRAIYYFDEVSRLQDVLTRKAKDSEEESELLRQNRKRWQLTLEHNTEDQLSDDRLNRINVVIHKLDSVKSLFQTDLQNIQVLEDRLTDKGNRLKSLSEKVRDQKNLLGARLFSIDSPGFFEELSTLDDTAMIVKYQKQVKKSIQSDVKLFKADFLVSGIVIILLFIFLLIFFLWFKTHYSSLISLEKFDLSQRQLALVNSPVILAIFSATFLTRFVIPDLPMLFKSINIILFMIAMSFIVIRVFGSKVKIWILALLILLILTIIYELFYYQDIIFRMALLIFSLSGFVLFLLIIILKPFSTRFNKGFALKLYRINLLVFIVLLFSAIIGNLVGAVTMAEFFTFGVIQATILAIAIHLTTIVSDTLVFLFLASNSFQKLNVIKDEFRVIYKKVTRLINLLLWFFFFSTVLNVFRVKDTVFDWTREMLTSGWQLGEVAITPKTLLVFIFVIWLSILLTRIVRYILEKDVFTRISTSKGMPSTIILLVKIGMISAGFFLAAAASGIQLTNISIVLGAFSVGIGFGLQNIFNNMVSGFILAFERPIKVGDTVQVGDLMGVVLSIGLRSSTVKSFDGAEVIVPNGNLISNEMINWTLSDQNRRMDIRVGVAYGTDPEKVLAILKEVAAAHELVGKTPAPSVFFIGFGESSLDFRLTAWTDIDHRLSVESELNVSINRELKEAGIEIPFPQHDLHIRSDATKPKPAPKPKSTPGRVKK